MWSGFSREGQVTEEKKRRKGTGSAWSIVGAPQFCVK